MIFVTVGSRNYPFDRLFKKLDKLYDDGILREEMFAQIGASNYNQEIINIRILFHKKNLQKK